MSQPVILLADVPGLGQLGDQCKVKEGYARNYLLPQQLAVLATPNNVKKFERRKEKINSEREELISEAKKTAEKMAKVGLEFEKPVGQGGRLFGSVTPMDIAAELSRQGASVEKRSILMHGPLKTPGDHKIRVRIHSQVVVDIPVKIIGIQVNQNKFEEPEEEATAEKPKKEAKVEAEDKEEKKEEN